MKFSFAQILKYTISFAIAILIFYYLYKDQDFDQITSLFFKVDYFWIVFSMFLMILSHWSRAWRWALMLHPFGYNVGISRPFLALMFGYLTNMLLPRIGEISRSTMLNRTANVPINLSFGAVITERVIDLLFMCAIAVVTLFLEFDKLGDFLLKTFGNGEALMQKVYVLVGLGFLGLLGLLVLFLLRNKLKKLPLYEKIAVFLYGLKDGLLSLSKLSKNDQILFWLHSVIIWVLYYFTSYVLFFCIPETADLGFMCGLSILVMTAISIAAPVQGGIGVYHVFVAATFTAYGVESGLGKDFAFLMHSVQTFLIVTAGAISFLISMFLKPKKHENSPQNI